MGDVKVSDMVTPDTKIESDGSVVGTLKYVSSFPEFNQTVLDEQNGNYFPLTLSVDGEPQRMTLKKNGQTSPEKTDMNFDKDIIFRVGSNSDTFAVEVDSKPIITLNFEKATLQNS